MKYRFKSMLERIAKAQPILERDLLADGFAPQSTMRWLVAEQYIKRVGHPSEVDRRARAPAAAYIVAPRGQNFLDGCAPMEADPAISQTEFRALAEAGLMPLDEYVWMFGSAT